MIRTYVDCPCRGRESKIELSNYGSLGVPAYEKKCICKHPDSEEWFCENIITYGTDEVISKCPRGFVR